METPPTEINDENPAVVLRRVKRNSVGAWLVFAVFALIFRGFRPFLGLTCSAAVTIISFLWLEEIIMNLLQPSPRLRAWRVVVRTLGRFALLGVALSVTILVARFDAVSVLLGFSVVVVGIVGEALYATYKSFAV